MHISYLVGTSTTRAVKLSEVVDKFIDLLILPKHFLLGTILLRDDHNVDYGNAIRRRVHGHVCLHYPTHILAKAGLF